MGQNDRVVIIGAGPTGLALALGLSHYGVPSVVLEQKVKANPHSRAPAIHARTMEILKCWGVLDRFLSEGHLVRNIAVWVHGRLKPEVTIDFSRLSDFTGLPGVLVLPQPQTEALLLEEVQKRRLSEVRFGHRALDWMDWNNGVKVRVSSPQGISYEIEGAFLVGCDGAHSIVRERLGLMLEGKTYSTKAFLADIRLSDARADLPWPRLASRAEGALFAIKIDSQTWRIIWLEKHFSECSVFSPAILADQVEALFGKGDFETIWTSLFHLHCRNSPKYRCGRVLLAGDAAHLNSPAGGQGMNSGIQDAHNLAWKLAATFRSGDVDEILDSYEAERKSAMENNVDKFTDRLTRLVLLPPFLRRIALGLIKRLLGSPLFLRWLLPKVAMFRTRYHHSPMLLGRGHLIGRRAPDGILRTATEGAVRLLDLADPDGAVLVFVEAGDENRYEWILNAVSTRSDVKAYRITSGAPVSPRCYTDVGGNIAKQWGVRAGTFAILRPDGHVGWTKYNPSAAEILSAIEKILRRKLGISLSCALVFLAWRDPSLLLRYNEKLEAAGYDSPPQADSLQPD